MLNHISLYNECSVGYIPERCSPAHFTFLASNNDEHQKPICVLLLTFCSYVSEKLFGVSFLTFEYGDLSCTPPAVPNQSTLHSSDTFQPYFFIELFFSLSPRRAAVPLAVVAQSQRGGKARSCNRSGSHRRHETIQLFDSAPRNLQQQRTVPSGLAADRAGGDESETALKVVSLHKKSYLTVGSYFVSSSET